jgi:hypothetical protein
MISIRSFDIKGRNSLKLHGFNAFLFCNAGYSDHSYSAAKAQKRKAFVNNPVECWIVNGAE